MIKIKTAIVGFGLSGRVFHAPFLHCHQGFDIQKVVERNKQDSKTLYPYVEVVQDFQEVLNDRQIELIIVCTPNTMHYQMVSQALLAGKHVVVEKPFTTSTAEADALIDLAKKVNRQLFVYHNRRWDGDFLLIEKLLAENTLGPLHYFESHFDRYVPKINPARIWKNTALPASGVLFDLGSHLIHQAITLFGLPTSVKATIDTRRPESKVVDYFELIMHYNSLKVVLKSDMLVKDHRLRFLLKGDKAVFSQFGIDPQEAALDAGAMPSGTDWCVPNDDFYGLLQPNNKDVAKRIHSPAGNYMKFYDHVYEVLSNPQEPCIHAGVGRDVIRICELAIKSDAAQQAIPFE